MFSPFSRYRKLPDVVTTDAKGRTLASKALRRLPSVSGTFQHTIEDGDRLDHVALSITDSQQSGGVSVTPILSFSRRKRCSARNRW